jgi:hypothetical protein
MVAGRLRHGIRGMNSSVNHVQRGGLTAKDASTRVLHLMAKRVVSALMLKRLLAIACAADDALLELYGTALAVEYKAHHEPVTAADQRSNRLLVEHLNAAFPDIPVVAEESEPSAFMHFREPIGSSSWTRSTARTSSSSETASSR